VDFDGLDDEHQVVDCRSVFIRIKTTPNSPRRSVQLCESRRSGSRVSQVIVRHVGVAMDDDELESLKRLAETIRAKMEVERSEGLPLFAPENSFGGKNPPRGAATTENVRLSHLVEESRVIEGITEVFGALYRELGFERILPAGADADALRATVLARVANPSSKHRTAALLEEDFGIRVPLNAIYNMMDALHAQQVAVQQQVFAATRELFPGKVNLAFFDVTTLYFESTVTDVLRDFGYSKDQKHHSVQVVLALCTTDDGLPIGYKLFPGNTAEITTLAKCLTQWRQHIEIGRVVLIADRGMFSSGNLNLLEEMGLEYVVAAPLRKFSPPLRAQILNDKNYRLAVVGEDCAWVKEMDLGENRRLITSYSARRALKDQSDRARLVDKVTRKLGKARHPKVSRLISNRGYIKYTSTRGEASAHLDDDKIARDAAWDGMHGVITNGKDQALRVLTHYRRLWSIEAAFRVNKHDLKMRPIFHFKPERIQAHIAICFLAYALTAHARYRVSLQQQPISVEQLRNELLRVQASILKDKTTGARYRLPSHMGPAAKRIYRAFQLTRELTPTAL
jgi:hypothetical protein